MGKMPISVEVSQNDDGNDGNDEEEEEEAEREKSEQHEKGRVRKDLIYIK